MIEGVCAFADCSIEVGSIQTLSALMFFSNGTTQPREAVWVSDNASVAAVDSGGTVRGISSGTATIRATVGSMSATRTVRVLGRRLGSWRGEAVIKSCTATGRFDSGWCGDFYQVGNRMPLGLQLREEGGLLSGFVSIGGFGGELSIDAGSSLDAEGRIRISARSGGPFTFLGPFIAIIDPLRAQIGDTTVVGSFVMTVVGEPGSGLDGSVVIEADLVGVNRQ